MIPHLLVSSNKPKHAGDQIWFLVRIRPAYKSDRSLIAHEFEHVRQWWLATGLSLLVLAALVYAIPPLWPLLGLSPFAHGLLYSMVRPYRRWAEVTAHRVQVRHGGDVDHLARHLASSYRLKMTVDDARRALA